MASRHALMGKTFQKIYSLLMVCHVQSVWSSVQVLFNRIGGRNRTKDNSFSVPKMLIIPIAISSQFRHSGGGSNTIEKLTNKEKAHQLNVDRL
jgi:hypothetical protein